MRLHNFLIDNVDNEYVSVTVTLTEDPKLAGMTGTNEDDVGHHDNNHVYDTIEARVMEGTFIVDYEPDSGKNIQYVGSTITKDIISESKINENALIMQQYTKTPKVSVKIVPSVSSSRIPIDECARFCDKEQSFRCESFTYCRSTGTCNQFRERQDQISSTDFVANTDCNFYARNYSFDFTIWEKVRLRSQANEPITDNLTMDGCLRTCVQQENDKFLCNSLDICQTKDNIKCSFHHNHILEVPQGQLIKDETCLHFSRRYTSEFTAYVNASIDNDQFESIPIVGNVEFCAQSCATAPNGCTDFEMCTFQPGLGDKSECYLMRLKDGATNTKFATKKNPDCDHYHYKGVKPSIPFVPPGAAENRVDAAVHEEFSNIQSLRQSADTGDAVTTSTETTTEENKQEEEVTADGYTGGEMAGLAVGTLILGGIIGAVTFYFVARRSVTSGQDQGIVMKLIGRQGGLQ